MKFLDEAKVYIRSGDGGNGCVAFRREKYIEFGGPSGGNGGRRGHFLTQADLGPNALIDSRPQKHFEGPRGGKEAGEAGPGRGGRCRTRKMPRAPRALSEVHENPA